MSVRPTVYNRATAPPAESVEGQGCGVTGPMPQTVGLTTGADTTSASVAAFSTAIKISSTHPPATATSHVTPWYMSTSMSVRERSCIKHFFFIIFAATLTGFIVVLYLWLLFAADSIDPITGLVRLHSFHYFVYCFLGGFSVGIIHVFLTPLDVVKCRVQVGEYSDFKKGFVHLYLVEAGGSVHRALPLLYRGWVPTIGGYCIQGSVKFTLYEILKYLMLISSTTGTAVKGAQSSPPTGVAGVYRRNLTAEVASTVSPSSTAARRFLLYQFFIFLLSSCLAEVVADLFLAPWEAVKIRMQTLPSFPLHLRVALPRMWEAEGLRGFYKGLVPLWCRQVPHNMVKFSSFEFFVMGVRQFFRLVGVGDTVNKLTVSFLAGALAGLLCGVVSHPADTVLSKLSHRSSVQATHSTSLLANAISEVRRDNLGYDKTRREISSMLQSSIDTVRELGWRGIWKGFLPRLLMVSSMTALQLVMYDAFKVWVGLPTSQGVLLQL